MKRQLFTLLIFISLFTSGLKAQENFGPSEHSNKWLDGRELYVKTMDSVKVKINFLQTTTDWFIFEAEFLNQSTQNDVLIDPTLFQFGVIKTSDNKPCNVITNQLIPPTLEDAWNINTGNMLKKNTLEPKKSLYGLMFFKRCKKALTLKMLLPIEERYFLVEFEKLAK